MNPEFLIVFTSNGLVFAAILYLVMACEIPDPKRSATSRIWAKIDAVMTQRQETRARCFPTMVVSGSRESFLLEGQERQVSSFGPSVNKL